MLVEVATDLLGSFSWEADPIAQSDSPERKPNWVASMREQMDVNVRV